MTEHAARRTTLLATLALLAMTACWGSTFMECRKLLLATPKISLAG